MAYNVLFLKTGGYGDVVIDGGIILGAIRREHPRAKITAVVRDAGQATALKAIYRIDTGQPVVDFVRPLPIESRGALWWKRKYRIDRDEAWRRETQYPAQWDYAYDARPYVGKCYSISRGVPTVLSDLAEPLCDWQEAGYHQQLSIWTHKLQELGKTTIEIMAQSMGLGWADWDEVNINTPKVNLPVDGPYAVVSNATDGQSRDSGGFKTKQWDFNRLATIARYLSDKGITPVQLGIKPDRYIPNCLDYRGQTTFLEACEVVRNARLYVGIEGGLARVAGLMEKPAVVIFTSTPVPLFKTPHSIPITSDACPTQNGNCFWLTGQWHSRCALDLKLKDTKSGTILPPCSAHIGVKQVIIAIDKLT